MAKKLYKAIATVTLISVATRLISFLFRIFMSRKLGAEMLGVYQITISIFSLFVCFSSSGLPTTLSRKTAEYDNLINYDHSKSVFTSALILSIGLSLLTCILFTIFPNFLSVLFTDKRCIEIFILLMPSLLSTSIYCIIRAWFWGKRQYGIYSGIELLEEVLKIILTVSIFVMPIMQNNLTRGAAIAYVIGDFIIATILIILFFYKGGKLSKPKHFMEITKSAAPLTGTRIYGSLIHSATALILPILLIKAGLSTGEATAEYGRMSGMVMPMLLAPTTIVGALAVVIVPEIAKDKGSFGKINNQITKSLTIAALVSSIFLVIFLSTGDIIGEMLYNDSRSGMLLTMSAFVMIPLSISQLTSTVLNSLGKETWTFISNIISSILLLICLVILPKYVGIMAYPIGLTFYHMINLILNTYKIRKTTSIRLSYIYRILFYFLVGLISAAITSLIGNYITGLNNITQIIILIPIAAITFIIPVLPQLIRFFRARKSC